MALKISTTPTFNKTAKKLFDRDKKAMDTAVKAIVDNPTIGEEKKGDLSGIFVFKFKMNKQQILLSYTLLPNKEHPDT
ncbi:MAG: type II toxin-antitoxin system RelE/ParE family toxin, partial [Sulfuriferula sp.]